MHRLLHRRLEIAQVSDAMSTQAAVKAGTCCTRVKKTQHYSQQAIQRDQQGLAQGNRYRLLSRG